MVAELCQHKSLKECAGFFVNVTRHRHNWYVYLSFQTNKHFRCSFLLFLFETSKSSSTVSKWWPLKGIRRKKNAIQFSPLPHSSGIKEKVWAKKNHGSHRSPGFYSVIKKNTHMEQVYHTTVIGINEFQLDFNLIYKIKPVTILNHIVIFKLTSFKPIISSVYRFDQIWISPWNKIPNVTVQYRAEWFHEIYPLYN